MSNLTATPTIDPSDLEFTMADRLRKARTLAGLAQGELADLMGVSKTTIGNYESGATSNHRRIVIRQWALATSVPIAWLYTGSTDPDDLEISSTKWLADAA